MRFPALFAALILGLATLSSTARAEENPSGNAPEESAKVHSLLQMRLSANNVQQETVNTIESAITVELGKHESLKVVAGSELQRMLELEGQKVAAGCDDDSSCLSEIAGALGADYVVAGQLGKLDVRWVLTLTLIDGASQEAINRVRVDAGDLDAMPDRLKPAVNELVTPITGGLDTGPGIAPWLLAGAGGTALVAGAVLSVLGGMGWAAYTSADAAYQTERAKFQGDGTTTQKDVQSLAAAHDNLNASAEDWSGGGLIFTSVGIPLAVVGAGLLTGGLIWALSSPGE
jgi:TolB-like protein